MLTTEQQLLESAYSSQAQKLRDIYPLTLIYGSRIFTSDSTSNSSAQSPQVQRSLIPNHTRDNDVTQQSIAQDVTFTYTPEEFFPGFPRPGTMEFGEAIVSVGIDESGKVLSFICPQAEQNFTQNLAIGLVELSGKVEAEIGLIGGSIDPITGIGTVYLDDVQLLFWGEITIDSLLGGTTNFYLDKDEAAFIPLTNLQGGSELVVDSSGAPNDNTFARLEISALQGVNRGVQDGFLQELIIEGINLELPGFSIKGTGLEWTVNLQDPQPISGEAYAEQAHDLHMGH